MKNSFAYTLSGLFMLAVVGVLAADIAASRELFVAQTNSSEAQDSAPEVPDLGDIEKSGASLTAPSADEESGNSDRTVAAAPLPLPAAESTDADDLSDPLDDLQLNRRFHAVAVDELGVLRGRVSLIDPYRLRLIPLSDVVVSFVQASQVKAQVTTAADGWFQVEGLTPYGVYSVFASADAGYSAFSFAVAPPRPGPPADDAPGNGDTKGGDTKGTDPSAEEAEQAGDIELESGVDVESFVYQMDEEGDEDSNDETPESSDAEPEESEEEENQNSEPTIPAGEFLDITLVPGGDLGASPLPIIQPPRGVGGGSAGDSLFVPVPIPATDDDFASPFLFTN